MKRNILRLCMLTLLLIAVDQGIKILISLYCPDAAIELIPHFVLFRPVHNTDLSWFGSLGLRLFANPAFSIILNLVLFILAAALYRYIGTELNGRGKLVQVTFLFLFAGILCSTIDRVFWQGSLDYIRLEGLFTFDLKDCYITVMEILFIYSFIRYRNKEAWKAFSIRAYFNSMLRR